MKIHQMRWAGLVTFFIFLTVACTEGAKPPPPKLSQYKEVTTLMLNIAKKFLEEQDAKKLHEIAIATQRMRLLACVDFDQECTLYGEFINLTINGSADSLITPSERREMHQKVSDLKSSIERGLRKLQR